MSKNIVWDSPENELLDITIDRENDIEFIDDTPDTPTTEKRDYILRNKKKYYKTNKKYIYRSEDGFYSYRIYHKPSKTNSFVNKDITTGERFNTPTKAEKALKDHIIQLEKNNTFKNRKITFHDVWTRIKDTTAKEESTITKYESIYKHHVKAVFGDTAMQELSYSDINDYLEKMYKMGDGGGTGQAGYSYTFTQSIYKFFWLIFHKAQSYKIISNEELRDFTDGISMPKEQGERKKRILSGDEIQKIYELLKPKDKTENTKEKYGDYLLPFLISLYTGARPAEAWAVRFSDFDLDNNTLTIDKQIVEFQGVLTFKPPKTFSRVIDIPQALKDEVIKRKAIIEKARAERPDLFELNKKRVNYALKDTKEGQDDIYDDMIMTDTKGRYNAYSSFQYYAKIIRKDICPNDKKREDFSFYTFRKTALSIMASHSIPIGALMRITGHKKNETLFEYYYSDENEFAQRKIKDSVQSMESLIKTEK